MRAMVLREAGTADVMRCEEVPSPRLGPDDVLIQVKACGVCFHDVVTRNGVLKYRIEMPLIPGHEVAGIVTELGASVSGFRIGDRVATTAQRSTCGICTECRKGQENRCIDKRLLGDAGFNGGYSELAAVSQRSLAKIPDGITFEAASIVGCAVCTGLNAIRDVAQARAGESILINGAGGGVGLHAVQLARASGLHVLAATSSSRKVDAIRKAGAHDVILFERPADFSREVIDLTGGRGVDILLDNVGTALFQQSRRSLAMGGRWVMLGQVTGDFVPFNPAQLFLKDISMLSAVGSLKRQLDDAMGMVSRGALSPVIEAVLRLEDAPQAHRLMEAGDVMGRIVLRP